MDSFAGKANNEIREELLWKAKDSINHPMSYFSIKDKIWSTEFTLVTQV